MTEMSSKDNKKNKRRKSFDSSNIYIKIDGNNKLEEQSDDIMNQLLMESVNSILVENIGKEINKFFVKILPENKEGDVLKFNYALAARIKKKFNLSKLDITAKCEEYMNSIINMKIDQNSPLALTRDINEKLSFILMVIFKHIKKYGKFSDYEEVKQCASSNHQNGILDLLQNKSESNLYSYMYTNDSYIDDNDLYETGNKNTGLFFDNKIDIEPMRMSHAIQPKRNDIMNINNMYNYKSQNLKNDNKIPSEVFILREKFENIKVIKLSIKRHNELNNDLILLDQSDVIYNIFVLINLKFLFQNLMGIELDLSNEMILKDEIFEINPKFETILKKTEKNRKKTNYKAVNKTLSKHMFSLQMIVIYWYFTTLLNDIKICNFTIPINFEDKIKLMLRENKIISVDFNIFANLTDKLTEITVDFNTLDSTLFFQILSFLFKNSQLTKCHLSLFPSEEYFEPRHLFYLFNQSAKSKFNKKEVKISEDIDIFMLRKLSENFETNISKLFIYFMNMPKLKEISLIFDIPSIIEKVSNYEMIIIKLIINLFIYINKSTKSSKFSFKKITILADNLCFDNRKYPFLVPFFENINIYENNVSQIESLTLKFKIFNITNFYRIIPYNITHLSLGSFDLISLQYFVEYITSSEFSVHSQIKFLQISLSNSLLVMDEICFQTLEQLLIEHPKNLEEICINTALFASQEQIEKLLINTNYNKIQRITLSFNVNNSINKMFKTLQKKDNNEDLIENIMDLYYIKNDDVYAKNKNIILTMMYKVGNKFNKSFMDYHIFSQLEKFLCNKDKKTIIFQ